MTQAELYVVATPLGNRSDITLRAIEVLKQTTWIFAEDTRETFKLLELCGIAAAGKKIQSYASHNLKKATAQAVSILEGGESIALVTDRGTPGISDPGALLVSAARDAGVRVLPVPGASAVTALVSVSGIPDGFVYLGFLPKEAKYRSEMFESIAALGLPACFYESPRRIRETLSDLKAAFAQGRVFWGREMTKLFEEYRWEDLATLDVQQAPEQGEYVVLVQPGPSPRALAWQEEVKLRAASDREWSKDVAARHGVTAKEVYNALQLIKRPAEE
jgi:16S rRNA (cytidine1402-2'-O)-methyltransferase